MRKLIGIFIMMIFTGTIFTGLGMNNVIYAENIFFEGFEEGIIPRFKQQSITNLGDFYAEIGLKGERKSFANLEGAIKNRGRIIIVNGIVEKDDRQSRFQGLFRGSFFILQFPINSRIGNIFGQVRINSDTKEFTGLWKTRGIRLNGWIEGSFN